VTIYSNESGPHPPTPTSFSRWEPLPDSPTMYADPETIYEELAPQPGLRLVPPVRLLRSDWIISRAAQLRAATSTERRHELTLPRRQELEELEPEAFYSAEEVKALPRGPRNAGFPMAVLAVSHSWESRGHPDPEGRTLMHLAHAITTAQTFQVKTSRSARGSDSSDGTPPQNTPSCISTS